MNIVLWVLQVLLGIFFLYNGAVHFILPQGLPPQMAWMYDLAPALHYFSGTAQILAAFGLILPGIFKIQTRLTVYAALGLVLVMLSAAVWHFTRGEIQNAVMNLIIAALAGFVAYGRWKLKPLKDKAAALRRRGT